MRRNVPWPPKFFYKLANQTARILVVWLANLYENLLGCHGTLRRALVQIQSAFFHLNIYSVTLTPRACNAHQGGLCLYMYKWFTWSVKKKKCCKMLFLDVHFKSMTELCPVLKVIIIIISIIAHALCLDNNKWILTWQREVMTWKLWFYIRKLIDKTRCVPSSTEKRSNGAFSKSRQSTRRSTSVKSGF